MSDMQVWVGCMGCYNGGGLVGYWLDAEDADIDMQTFESHVSTPVEHSLDAHEELWVFDVSDETGILRTECSPAEAARIAEVVAEVPEGNRMAFAVYLENVGGEVSSESVKAFEEAYCGTWDSREDYAQELAEDIGAIDHDARWPNSYIDWERATRDLFMTDYYSTPAPGGQVYVFCNI